MSSRAVNLGGGERRREGRREGGREGGREEPGY